MAMNDHRAENQGLLLGRIWFFLSPLLRIAVYALIFGLLLAGRRPGDFIAFLAVGLFVFGLVESIITKIGRIFETRRELLTSLFFPRVLLPVSVLVRQLLEFRYEALVLLVAILVTTRRVSLGWLPFVFGLIPLALVFALGAGLVVAVLVASVPDVSKLLPPVFRMVFYASGVIFPLATVLEGHPAEPFLPLNPFYLFIEISRHLLLEPRLSAILLWSAAVVWALASLTFGMWLLVRREHLLVRS